MSKKNLNQEDISTIEADYYNALKKQQNPEERKKTYHSLCVKLSGLNQNEKAYEAAKRFNEEFPDFGFTLMHKSLRNLKRFDEALEVAEKFYQRFPNLEVASTVLNISRRDLDKTSSQKETTNTSGKNDLGNNEGTKRIRKRIPIKPKGDGIASEGVREL